MLPLWRSIGFCLLTKWDGTRSNRCCIRVGDGNTSPVLSRDEDGMGQDLSQVVLAGWRLWFVQGVIPAGFDSCRAWFLQGVTPAEFDFCRMWFLQDLLSCFHVRNTLFSPGCDSCRLWFLQDLISARSDFCRILFLQSGHQQPKQDWIEHLPSQATSSTPGALSTKSFPRNSFWSPLVWWADGPSRIFLLNREDFIPPHSRPCLFSPCWGLHRRKSQYSLYWPLIYPVSFHGAICNSWPLSNPPANFKNNHRKVIKT